MDHRGEIKTSDVGIAVAALRSGRCTKLTATHSSGGWGDAGVARLTDALGADGGGAVRSQRRHYAGAGLTHRDNADDDAGAHLRELNLPGNRITHVGAARLAAALEGGACPVLARLNLGDNRIADVGVARLAAALEGGACPALTCLRLGNNQITDAGAARLAGALAAGACPLLATLTLGGNRITAEAWAPLIRFFMDQRGGIKTSDVGLAVAALRSGRCTSLSSSGAAGWGDAGAARLADTLEAGGGGVCLRELDLFGNRITDAGAARLAAAFEGGACPVLVGIKMHGNRVTDAGAARLAAAVEGGACPALKYITLGVNQPGGVSAAGRAQVRAAIALGRLRGRLVQVRRRVRLYLHAGARLLRAYQEAQARLEFRPDGAGAQRAAASFAAATAAAAVTGKRKAPGAASGGAGVAEPPAKK